MQRYENAVGGSAHINGPSIQAGEIHGGVHFHTRDTDGTSGRPPIPRQLLPVSPHFTDRVNDLAALNGLLDGSREESAPLVVVSGPAGVGKTSLVTRWLRSTAEDFPDGQLYADLRGHSVGEPAHPSEILGQFLRAFGTGTVPASLAEQTALWRSVTAGLRISVMVDNAFSAAQVRPLLPGGRGGLLVATSRHRLSGLRADGALCHQLGLLDSEAAAEVLSRGVGADRVRSEAQETRELIALCGGLPLALCLAAARLASRPWQPMRSLVEALTQGQGRLSALAIEGEFSVHHALDESYAVLIPEAARLYRRLALLPVSSLEARVAAVVCRIPLTEAERLLDVLVEANLLEDIGPDSYRFHDLVRLHAQERAQEEEGAPEREEALRRVCDWYLATATQAQQQLSPIQLTLRRTYAFPLELPCPFTDASGALVWLEAHRLDLLATVRTAYDKGWDDPAWQLVDALWPLFHRLRYHDLWAEAHEIGLRAARRGGDRAAERQMLNSGAIGFGVAGRTEEAIEWFTGSLAAAREAGDERDEGQALHGLGSAQRQLGNFRAAGELLRQAITTWERAGYPRGAALSRIVLGEMALESEGARWDGLPAADYFAQAHTTLLAVDDPYDAARALAFHGRALARDGAHTAGVAELHQALAFFEQAGALPWQARIWEMLGSSAVEQADTGTAHDCFARAKELYTGQSPSDAQRMAVLLAGLPDRPAEPGEDAEPV